MTSGDPVPGAPAPPGGTNEDEQARWRAISQLREEHPGWLLIWARYLQRYCAYSLFRARCRIELTAETLEQMVALINQAEQASRRPRARPPRAGT